MKRISAPFIFALCALALLSLPACRASEPAQVPTPPAEAPEPAPIKRTPLSPIPKRRLQSRPAPSPEQAPEEPDMFAELLEKSGRTPEDIPGGQLVIVQADGNEAAVWAYGREDGVWTPLFEEVDGRVGKNGVTGEKAEGDRRTPRGLYGLPLAFGVEADPGSLLPYRQVTGESYWVDDPDSRFYNQWVEGTAEQDWASAEHLADYPEQYAYAALIAYNTDLVVPGAGSAIFLHCGGSYTAGCVAIPRERMVELLQWLDPAQSPAILIF